MSVNLELKLEYIMFSCSVFDFKNSVAVKHKLITTLSLQ